MIKYHFPKGYKINRNTLKSSVYTFIYGGRTFLDSC